jgi:hypothetical protein
MHILGIYSLPFDAILDDAQVARSRTLRLNGNRSGTMDDHAKNNVTNLEQHKLNQPAQKIDPVKDLLSKLIDPAGLVFSKEFCQTTLRANYERKSA